MEKLKIQEIKELLEKVKEEGSDTITDGQVLDMVYEIIERSTLIDWINSRIKDSKEMLDNNGTTHLAVLKNDDTSGYGEEAENNNFEAGVISGLEEFKEQFGELLK